MPSMTPAELLREEGRIEVLGEMALWLGGQIAAARVRMETDRPVAPAPVEEG